MIVISWGKTQWGVLFVLFSLFDFFLSCLFSHCWMLFVTTPLHFKMCLVRVCPCAARRSMFQPLHIKRTTLSSSVLLLHFLLSFLLCPPVLRPPYLSVSFSACSLVCQVLGSSNMPLVECRKQSDGSLAAVCTLWLHCCISAITNTIRQMRAAKRHRSHQVNLVPVDM